jgi:single-strand DNA-binding protein
MQSQKSGRLWVIPYVTNFQRGTKINNITIAGTLGRDCELKTLNNGESVASFSVADSAGRDKGTIWWSCELWGKRASALSQYLTKGQAVAVSGSITENEWKDKDGNPRKTMKIRVNDVALQGGRKESSEPEEYRQPVAKKPVPLFDDDSDVPF